MISNEASGQRAGSGERVSGDDLDLIGGQFALGLRQLVNQLPVALDQRDVPSAARSELETKRTGAGEEIQPAHVFKRRNQVLDPVEQCFAHAVGRRSQPPGVSHRQRCSLPLPADDADTVRRVRRHVCNATLCYTAFRRSPECSMYFSGRLLVFRPAFRPSVSHRSMISPGSSGGSKNGWLSRLKTGLTKTRVNIVGLFSGGVVDEEFLEELELALIGADAGVATAAHLIDALRTRIKLHGLLTQDEVRRALSDEITLLLAPAEGSHRFFEGSPARDHGGRSQWRREDNIDRQACQVACESTQVGPTGGGRHLSRRGTRTTRDLGCAK